MLRKVLGNEITPRDKISLNGLGITKAKSGGLSMMPKTGTEVAQDYTVFNYGPPIPQKDLTSQGRSTVARSEMKPAQNLFPPGNSTEKIGK